MCGKLAFQRRSLDCICMYTCEYSTTLVFGGIPYIYTFTDLVPFKGRSLLHSSQTASTKWEILSISHERTHRYVVLALHKIGNLT